MKRAYLPGLLTVVSLSLAGCQPAQPVGTVDSGSAVELEVTEPQAEPDIPVSNGVVAMTGDINLADDWNSMEYYKV